MNPTTPREVGRELYALFKANYSAQALGERIKELNLAYQGDEEGVAELVLAICDEIKEDVVGLLADYFRGTEWHSRDRDAVEFVGATNGA